MIQPDENAAPMGERMRYGMLGEDLSSTDEKLEKFTGEVAWEYLEPHLRAGTLIYVDRSLDLAVVGRAIADDDVAAVKAWRESGDLVTPSEPHADYWRSSGATFRVQIVSPFVLMQQREG